MTLSPHCGDQKIFGLLARVQNGLLQVMWLLTSPKVAHGTGSKAVDNFIKLGGADYQSSLVVNPHSKQGSPLQPSCDQRSLSYENFLRLENYVISHDVIGCSRQFVGKGVVRDHEVCLLHLAIVIGSRLYIAATCTLSGLGIGPCKILVAAFLVSFALDFVVAEPLARYFPAVGYIISDFRKAGNRPGLEHNRERESFADTEYALQLGIGLLKFDPVLDNRFDLVDLAC
jgi:hypothetical protein